MLHDLVELREFIRVERIFHPTSTLVVVIESDISFQGALLDFLDVGIHARHELRYVFSNRPCDVPTATDHNIGFQNDIRKNWRPHFHNMRIGHRQVHDSRIDELEDVRVIEVRFGFDDLHLVLPLADETLVQRLEMLDIAAARQDIKAAARKIVDGVNHRAVAMADDNLIDFGQIGIGEIDDLCAFIGDSVVGGANVSTSSGQRRQNILEAHGNEDQIVTLGGLLSPAIDELLVTLEDVVFESSVVSRFIDKKICFVVGRQNIDGATFRVDKRLSEVRRHYALIERLEFLVAELAGCHAGGQ